MKNNFTDKIGPDIDSSNHNKEEYDEIMPKIEISKAKMMPLLCWDIFMYGYHRRLIADKKKMEMKQVLTFAKKFNWKNDLKLAFSENDYEALIITDKNQNIIWVNDGFSSMTGYSKKFAINKTPKFLQGKDTSVKTKNRIKEKIKQDKPFKEIIINYKKDQTAYNCEVNIIPLYNGDTTHYIAFEKKAG